MDQTILIDTPYDGSCFFHSILRCVNTRYINFSLEEKSQFVRQFRDELAEEIIKINPQTSQIYYTQLSKGNLAILGETCTQYSVDTLQKVLRSNDMVGHEFLEYVSTLLDINIYIIFNKDVYPLGKDLDIYYKNRSCIVLYYSNSHFQSIGIIKEGQINTRFDKNHILIKTINSRYNISL